jgi:hypothetical protein
MQIPTSYFREFGLNSTVEVKKGRGTMYVYSPAAGMFMITNRCMLGVQNGWPYVRLPGTLDVNSAALMTFGAALAPPAMAVSQFLQLNFDKQTWSKQETAEFMLRTNELTVQDRKYYETWKSKKSTKEDDDSDDSDDDDDDGDNDDEKKKKQQAATFGKEATAAEIFDKIAQSHAAQAEQARELREECKRGDVYMADIGVKRTASLVEMSDNTEPNLYWVTGHGDADKVHAFGTVPERNQASARNHVEATTEFHRALLIPPGARIFYDPGALSELSLGLADGGDFQRKDGQPRDNSVRHFRSRLTSAQILKNEGKI